MKAGAIGVGHQTDFGGLLHHAGRRGRLRDRIAESVAQALLRELIGGIEIQGAAKVGQGFHLPIRFQFGISALEMVVHELLARYFAGGHIFEIARGELSSMIEFLICLVRRLGLDFYSTGERGPGLF